MRRPQGPQGEETAEEAPAEAEDQGPPDVAPSPRQPACHVRGQTRAASMVQWRFQLLATRVKCQSQFQFCSFKV